MTYRQKYNWRAFCNESIDQIENYQQAEAENFKGWCMHHRLEIQPDGTRVSMQELKSKGLYYSRPASELVFMRFGEHMKLHMTGKHLTAEHRNKIAEALKGRTLSAEARKKLSESRKGSTLSEETRLKLSEAKRGKNLSEEARQKIAAALSGENHPNFGKHPSAETRLKMSEAHKGENNPFFGKHFSEDHRRKLSEALKGKHSSDETRQKLSEAHRGKHWWNDGVSCKHAKECPGEGWKRGRCSKEATE